MLSRVALVRTDVSEELSALVFLHSVRRLLVRASVIPTLPFLLTLMKEALGSSETSVFTRAKRPNIPEDTILQNQAFQKEVQLFKLSERTVHVAKYFVMINIKSFRPSQ
jgi:hypothetical protein